MSTGEQDDAYTVLGNMGLNKLAWEKFLMEAVYSSMVVAAFMKFLEAKP